MYSTTSSGFIFLPNGFSESAFFRCLQTGRSWLGVRLKIMSYEVGMIQSSGGLAILATADYKPCDLSGLSTDETAMFLVPASADGTVDFPYELLGACSLAGIPVVAVSEKGACWHMVSGIETKLQSK